MEIELLARDRLWGLITIVSLLLILVNAREIMDDLVARWKKIKEGKFIEVVLNINMDRNSNTPSVYRIISVLLFIVLFVLVVILFLQKDYLPE